MKRKLVSLIIGIIIVTTMLPIFGIQAQTNPQTHFTKDNNTPMGALGYDEWVMFHHDLAHTGYSTSGAPHTNNTHWANMSGVGICPFDSLVMSSPAAVNGKVYIGGQWSYDVYCYDAYTGEQQWIYPIGNYVLSSPAIYEDKLYIGSFDRKVYCLNAETGELIWNFTTINIIWSSPAVINDRVYIGAGNTMYCLNATGNGDGSTTEIWTHLTGGNIYSSPAVVNNRVYFGSLDRKVYCLDAEGDGDGTTTEIWNYTTGQPIWSSPAVANGYVYIGCHDANVYCLNADTGALEWFYPTDLAVMSSPAVAYNNIYVGSMNGTVYCLDSVDGGLNWETKIGTDIGSSPAVADNKVYIGETKIGVFCLDASTGDQIWNYTTEPQSGCDSSPAIAEGIVYIGSYDGYMYAFKDLNSPPTQPDVTGPTGAAPGFNLTFTIVSTDFDSDDIYYNISWGDGNITDWFGPYPSGEPITMNYSWITEGEYINVLYNHHFTIILLEHGLRDDLVEISSIALCEELHGFCHPLGCLVQAFPTHILPQGIQNLLI